MVAVYLLLVWSVDVLLTCESVFSVVSLCLSVVWYWFVLLDRDHLSQYHYGNKPAKRYCEMLFKMKNDTNENLKLSLKITPFHILSLSLSLLCMCLPLTG